MEALRFVRITREAMFLEPTVAEFPPPWQHCCPWSVMTMNTRKKCLCSSIYIPGNGCRRILARLRCTSIRKATRSRHSRPSASGATRARTCPPTSLGGSRVLQARGIRGRVSTRGGQGAWRCEHPLAICASQRPASRARTLSTGSELLFGAVHHATHPEPLGSFNDLAEVASLGGKVRARVADAIIKQWLDHATSPWHSSSSRFVELGNNLRRKVVVQCWVRPDALCKRGNALGQT